VTFDDGSGPALYVGGMMSLLYPGSPIYYSVARWNGRTWTLVDAGLPSGFINIGPIVQVLDDGSGPRLRAWWAGATSYSPPWGNAVWNGSAWEPGPANLVEAGSTGVVPKLSFDVGSGMAIYGIRGISLNVTGVARWTGTQWEVIGTPDAAIGLVYVLAVYNDGSGPALYAAGGFTGMDGVPARNIARWDGQPLVGARHRAGHGRAGHGRL
jgi:hypothetical protein